MIKKLLFILTLTAFIGNVKAQTPKPDVLVIGNGNAAAAAALQAAISGVKTTILLQAGGFDISSVDANLHSGIESLFLKKIKAIKAGAFDKQAANEVLTKWADSTKNLTLIRNTMWVKAERAGSNWSIKLSDGSTIKAKVLINPADGKLNNALKIVTPETTWNKLTYETSSHRTSVAAGKSVNGSTDSFYSMYQFFIPAQENLVWISDPQSMLMGQAAGATAAYAAFFSTKTSLSNLKTIQGELINYKLAIMPFADIKETDTNWKAIQMVGLTGVLKADVNEHAALFSPDKIVTTAEIRQVIKDFYYKAQIWFDDFKGQKMTIGATLDMVCYVGNKSPENTKREVEKKWKTAYQFKTELDLDREINRREFAVLLQDYMPPFNVNIDRTGKVVR